MSHAELIIGLIKKKHLLSKKVFTFTKARLSRIVPSHLVRTRHGVRLAFMTMDVVSNVGWVFKQSLRLKTTDW